MRKLIFLLALLVLVGCNTQAPVQQPIVSPDAIFQFKSFGGFIAPAYSVQELIINKTDTIYQIFSSNSSLTEQLVTPTDPGTYTQLISTVQSNGFLNMNSTYRKTSPNPDTGLINITLVQPGISKTVQIVNLDAPAEPASLQTIVSAFQDVVAALQVSP